MEAWKLPKKRSAWRTAWGLASVLAFIPVDNDRANLIIALTSVGLIDVTVCKCIFSLSYFSDSNKELYSISSGWRKYYILESLHFPIINFFQHILVILN